MNIQLFISTTGTINPVVIGDFGDRTFSHPTTNYEITLEYTFEELFNSQDILNLLVSGAITFTDSYGHLITTQEQLYQTSIKPDSTYIVFPAGEIIFGHRAVIVDSDQVFLFDPTNNSHLGRCIGVSNNAASIGNNVEIITEGKTLTGIPFVTNTTYYVDSDGSLTNIKPLTGIRQVVGFTTDINSMIVRIGKSVFLV